MDSTYQHLVSDAENNKSYSIHEKLLITNMNCLGRLISPNLSTISECTLADIYKNQLLTIDSQQKLLQTYLHSYMILPDHDISLCEEVADMIENAINWCSDVRVLYQKHGMYKKSQAKIIYDNLPKFSNNSLISVYEFFRRFSAYTEDFDIPEQRAELLYNKFLEVNIQEEVSECMHDYEGMKRLLIHRYGDIKTITCDLLNPVKELSKPANNENVLSNLAYYRTLNSSIQKIKKLLNHKDIPHEEAENYIYSQDFLYLLLTLVPLHAKLKFTDKMIAMDQDTIRIQGKISFDLLVAAVKQSYQSFDVVARTEDIPVPNQFVLLNSSSNQATSSDRDYPSSEESSDNPKSKPISQFEFPCVLDGHDHQLKDCCDFFYKSPRERVEERKRFPWKHCLVCLQSSELCNSKSCGNLEYIPKELICKECQYLSVLRSKKFSYSILFCFDPDHTKPNNIDILRALGRYVPGFSPKLLKAPVSLASQFQVVVGTRHKSTQKSIAKEPDYTTPPPVFDTSSGTAAKLFPSTVKRESNNESMHIMQILNINNQKVLCLFDRGANQHLVDGQLAHEIGMRVVNKEVSTISVVSGGKVWSDYGTYQMILGPTPTGEYFEIQAQGMKRISNKFPLYDLSEVNNEAVNFLGYSDEVNLPKYIGGAKVGLLIGLKSTELDPVLIFTLPSGIGVYKSPFKDIFGSYYCYGGPHDTFSKVNKIVNGNVNHFNIYLAESVSQYKNAPYQLLGIDSNTFNECRSEETFFPTLPERSECDETESVLNYCNNKTQDIHASKLPSNNCMSHAQFQFSYLINTLTLSWIVIIVLAILMNLSRLLLSGKKYLQMSFVLLQNSVSQSDKIFILRYLRFMFLMKNLCVVFKFLLLNWGDQIS